MGEDNSWAVWIGIAFGAYILYSMTTSAASSATPGSSSSSPSSNAAGNEWTCPAGTVYSDSGEQASGGGTCL